MTAEVDLINIKEKIKLNFLDRFRRIRNEINYQGFRTSISQTQEIVDFWNMCGKEILLLLKKDIRKIEN